MRKWRWLVAVGMVTAAGGLAWQFCGPIVSWVQTVCGRVLHRPPVVPQPDAGKYRALAAALDTTLCSRRCAATFPCATVLGLVFIGSGTWLQVEDKRTEGRTVIGAAVVTVAGSLVVKPRTSSM